MLKGRRPFRPRFDGLEVRDLPSAITAMLATSGPHPSALALAQHLASGGTVSMDAGGMDSSGMGDPPPFVPGPGNPLPRELARERFHAAFSGSFYAAPPLYTGESKILSFRGLGTSSQFVHGDYQMAIILPKNPADPTTGGAYLQDKSLNSTGAIAFDLMADPQSFDRQGRPTRLTFTTNSNIFSGVDYCPQGSGTVRIRYFKDTAAVFFDGLLFTNGITNPLRNQDVQARGGRLVPRSH